MRGTTPLRRRLTVAAALLAAVTLAGGVVGVPAAPVAAAPGTGGTGVGNEGENPLLRDVLADAGRGYLDARTKLDNSHRRQRAMTQRLQQAERRLAALTTQVGEVASVAYRTGRLTPMSALLNSVSPDAFLQRAAAVELIAARDDRRLRELKSAREAAAAAKAAVDAETREQQRQLAVMARRKQETERALVEVGGSATGGLVSATSPVARAAPRNSDGSWPGQSCSVPDPTTSGCITARTLNALQESRRAGFARFVSCYRPGGPYEHPKGRACDFSSERGGFGGDAQGQDRIYGNNLAAFLVRNADRLGVLYVIWYRQIWFPATGWRHYNSGAGDPSSDHTNHVHLSMF